MNNQNKTFSYNIPFDSNSHQRMKLNLISSNAYEPKVSNQGNYFNYNSNFLNSFPISPLSDNYNTSFKKRFTANNYVVNHYNNPNMNYYNAFTSPNENTPRPKSHSIASLNIQNELLNKRKVSLPPIKDLIDQVDSLPRRNTVTEGIVNHRNNNLLPDTVLLTASMNNEDFNKNTCSTCFKSFKKPSTLKRHLITHTNIKPFKCSYCGRAFNVKHNLVRHKKRHDEISEQAVKNVLIKE